MKSDVFDQMQRNYRAAAGLTIGTHYSAVWDKPEYRQFADLIADPTLWPAFQSVGITTGMGGARNLSRPAADVEIRDEKICRHFRAAFTELEALVGRDFACRHVEADIGRPNYVPYNGLKLTMHDMRLIYNAKHLADQFAGREGERLVFVEIGAGFGALAAKLKILFPRAKIALFDLPEANAIQTYYLDQRFPDARIFLCEDFLSRGIAGFLQNDDDFAVLPGAAIADLPENCAEAFINTRSMMEMAPSVIAYYFRAIHRALRVGGLFYCVNRYQKPDVGVAVRIKEYPFDSCWHIVRSQPAWTQPHIHELLAERTARPSAFPPSVVLADLPPVTFADLQRDVSKALHKVAVLLKGSSVGSGNVGVLRGLIGKGEHPADPIRQLRGHVGRLRRRFG